MRLFQHLHLRYQEIFLAVQQAEQSHHSPEMLSCQNRQMQIMQQRLLDDTA